VDLYILSPMRLHGVALGQLSTGTYLPLRLHRSTLTDRDAGLNLIFPTASLQSGVSPLGTVVSGFVMDRWGRRFTMRAGLVPIFIGYVIIAFAPSQLLVIIGRFITGLSCGFAAPASSVSMKSTFCDQTSQINCFCYRK
jgi:MFS family permease